MNDQTDVKTSVTEKKTGQKGRKKNWHWLLLLLLLLLIIGGLVGYIFYGKLNRPTGGGGLISYDTMAKNGNLPGKTKAQIEAELNQVVKEGEFNIVINPKIEFQSGASKGVANIENIKPNHYLMRVMIRLDEGNREIVYQSKAIKPGQYIQYIDLSGNLQKGTYNATAMFDALNAKTGEKEGSAGAQVKLIVKS